ncbi:MULTISPECIES: response regulator transcription factor [Microbacterium]|uniref:Response regulator transcription factor n=1 Tax=Microbacterium resistens TaxID=156977 RepID=A0ABY3RSI2_9MICO|nr:response regulator transcription factor [Microbacterium resistens]MBW1639309.1 response regulator transcription factor [Microbacterium resistens]MDA4891342.1 response regulator transcription factor [Streptomyces sp. MS2A]UGS25676.1 response regulator transcription factor [Microbacterium resistens]
MRILICEDSVLLREGLARLLEDAGHDVVAALPDATALDETVDRTDPELCILDVRLPPTFVDEGIRAALALRRRLPRLPLLVLSQYVEERYASDLIIAQTGSGPSAPGPLGYLLKDRVADVSDFIESVERIAAGATVLDPEVVAQLLTRRNQDDRMRTLTERERTVLALIAEGKSNQAIAGLLFLSEASVEKHITAIFQKLGLEPDESGNRRVLAAIAHIENSAGLPAPAPQTRQTGTTR